MIDLRRRVTVMPVDRLTAALAAYHAVREHRPAPRLPLALVFPLSLWVAVRHCSHSARTLGRSRNLQRVHPHRPPSHARCGPTRWGEPSRLPTEAARARLPHLQHLRQANHERPLLRPVHPPRPRVTLTHHPSPRRRVPPQPSRRPRRPAHLRVLPATCNHRRPRPARQQGRHQRPRQPRALLLMVQRLERQPRRLATSPPHPHHRARAHPTPHHTRLHLRKVLAPMTEPAAHCARPRPVARRVRSGWRSREHPQSHEEAASPHQDGVGLCSTGLAVWGRCCGGVRARKIILSFLLHQLFFGGARVGDSRDVARS